MCSLLQNKLGVVFVLLLFAFGWTTDGIAQQRSIEVTPQNTRITFEIKHLGVLTVKGSFDSFIGSLTLTEDKLVSIECQVDVVSINTQEEARDKTLRSEAYFNVSEFPQIKFIATEMANEGKLMQIVGLLTIKNSQQTIALDLEDKMVSGSRKLVLNTQISREQFTLDFGTMDALIGDTVKIEVEILL